VKLKLDENLPVQLHPILQKLADDVDTVPHEGLAGRDDLTVWTATQEAARFLITQDLDFFSDIRRYTPGSHHGLLIVRLRDPSRRALIQRIQSVFQTEEVDRWSRCFVVVTDRKIRVRRPRQSDPTL
jgi:predicted nuclease of predicted toxin-antitoxin system